jgi:conjugal transfer pilus assembly protein TraW
VIRLIGGLALSVLLASAWAAEGDVIDVGRSVRALENPASELSGEDFRLIEQAQEQSTAALQDPDLKNIARSGRAVLEGALNEQFAMSRAPAPAQDGEPRPSILVFVSVSMGEGALHDVLEDLRTERDAVALIRGGRDGETLGDVLRALRELIGEVTEGGVAPRLALDPNPFRTFQIEAVPTLVWVDATGAEVARAQGIANVTWFKEQVVGKGRRGDLGSFGSAVEVVERDMAEVISERLAQIDLTEQAEAARQRFWDNLDYLDLPRAQRHSVRLLDPTFEVTQTVATPDGIVLAREGDRINPLERVPFPDVVMVFDATRDDHVAFIREQIAAHRDRPITLISSVFDRKGSWAWLMRTSDSLGRPVHLLQEDVRTRFSIERVPTVVTADGLRFRLEEFVVVGPVAATDALSRDKPHVP